MNKPVLTTAQQDCTDSNEVLQMKIIIKLPFVSKISKYLCI